MQDLKARTTHRDVNKQSSPKLIRINYVLCLLSTPKYNEAHIKFEVSAVNLTLKSSFSIETKSKKLI